MIKQDTKSISTKHYRVGNRDVSIERSPEYLVSLVRELCKLPVEVEWVEFKRNNANPQEIGEYLSALANAATLAGKTSSYLLWGVDDKSHEVVGTTFSPCRDKVGNEELESWLLRLLSPKIHFRFFELGIDGQQIVLLEIGRAFGHPVQWQGQEFIRVGSYKKPLKGFPEKERALWRIFDQIPFENLIAAENISADEVIKLLDCSAYFELVGLPLPNSREGILQGLKSEDLILPADTGNWNITNLGAILFAKQLSNFQTLRRKAIRVILYKGNSRIETIKEQIGARGYANGFKGLISFINRLLPSNEVIGKALRTTVSVFPELAVRELVANALIHQDFLLTGTGPLVEIFEDRMEITNPGIPLVGVERFLDNPPRSRNEELASFMRRIGVCEERGSGIDKVVFQTETFQLPAPEFVVIGENTRATLFSPRPLTKMDKADRVRACYLHACLRYVKQDFMTNTSLRERFGIEPQNSATASRLMNEAVEAQKVKPYDKDASKKYMKYVPFWA
jgi:ATP-dependent DNA helicase RecG